jgi:hypothetical protein
MTRRVEHDKTRERLTELVCRVEDGAKDRESEPLADTFKKAKVALEAATRDIAALRRRATDLTRRSG